MHLTHAIDMGYSLPAFTKKVSVGISLSQYQGAIRRTLSEASFFMVGYVENLRVRRFLDAIRLIRVVRHPMVSLVEWRLFKPLIKVIIMKNLTVFNFKSNKVRVVSTDPLNPLFVAHDVASALGYKKPENAIARHCKRQDTTPKRGGGFLTIIPESDLYRLVFRSRLKSAESFTDWVVEDVLPTIRKTGKYELPKEPKLSKAQRGHLYQSVHRIAFEKGLAHPHSIWGKLKAHFGYSTYHDLTPEQYPIACRFLGIEPLEGELMPKAEPNIPTDQERIDHVKMWLQVAYHRYNQLNNLNKHFADLPLNESLKRLDHITSNLYDPISEANLFLCSVNFDAVKKKAGLVIENQNLIRGERLSNLSN